MLVNKQQSNWGAGSIVITLLGTLYWAVGSVNVNVVIYYDLSCFLQSNDDYVRTLLISANTYLIGKVIPRRLIKFNMFLHLRKYVI